VLLFNTKRSYVVSDKYSNSTPRADTSETRRVQHEHLIARDPYRFAMRRIKKGQDLHARFNGRQDLPYSGMKTVPLINVYTLSR